jgi:hypothetical protein
MAGMEVAVQPVATLALERADSYARNQATQETVGFLIVAIRLAARGCLD